VNIDIKEFKPSDQLNQFIELFWEGNFNVNSLGLLNQDVVPNGFVEIIIHLSDLHCDLVNRDSWSQSPDYTIIGMYTRPYQVKFRDTVHVFGMRFKPEGFYNIFGMPASEIKEGFEDMSDIAGKEFRDFCHRLKELSTNKKRIDFAEDFLYKSYLRNNFNFSYVNRAAEIIRQKSGFINIDDLSDQAFISKRQLEREFKSKIGVSPKFYMRLSRLNKVYRLLNEGRELDFTTVSYECEYSDQAHFIRDFKNFTGISPRVFVKDRGQYLVNPMR